MSSGTTGRRTMGDPSERQGRAPPCLGQLRQVGRSSSPRAYCGRNAIREATRSSRLGRRPSAAVDGRRGSAAMRLRSIPHAIAFTSAIRVPFGQRGWPRDRCELARRRAARPADPEPRPGLNGAPRFESASRLGRSALIGSGPKIRRPERAATVGCGVCAEDRTPESAGGTEGRSGAPAGRPRYRANEAIAASRCPVGRGRQRRSVVALRELPSARGQEVPGDPHADARPTKPYGRAGPSARLAPTSPRARQRDVPDPPRRLGHRPDRAAARDGGRDR